jgi:hypothetical protein
MKHSYQYVCRDTLLLSIERIQQRKKESFILQQFFLPQVFFAEGEARMEGDTKEQPKQPAETKETPNTTTKENQKRWFRLTIPSCTYAVHTNDEERIYLVCMNVFKNFIFQREGTKKTNYYLIIGHSIKPKRVMEVQRLFEHNLEIKNILVQSISKQTRLISDFYRTDTYRLSGPFGPYRMINELVKLSVHIAKWAIDHEIYESRQFLHMKETEMNFSELSLKDRLTFRGWIYDLQNGTQSQIIAEHKNN